MSSAPLQPLSPYDQAAISNMGWGQTEYCEPGTLDTEIGPQAPGDASCLDLDDFLSCHAVDDLDISALPIIDHGTPWTGHVPSLYFDGCSPQDIRVQPAEPMIGVLEEDKVSDSGYHSQPPRQSNVPTAPSLSKQNSHRGNQHHKSRASSAYGAAGPALQSGSTSSRRQADVSLPPCEICGRQPQNKGDQTKHEKTHSRPWKCSVLTCTWAFGTSNDRDRHELCKHNIVKAGAKHIGFVCPGCPPTKNGKENWWPRADNFKSHVVRRHPELAKDIKHTLASSQRERHHDDNMTEVSHAYTGQPPHSQADVEHHYQNQDVFSSTQWISNEGDPWTQPGSQADLLLQFTQPVTVNCAADVLPGVGLGPGLADDGGNTFNVPDMNPTAYTSWVYREDSMLPTSSMHGTQHCNLDLQTDIATVAPQDDYNEESESSSEDKTTHKRRRTSLGAACDLITGMDDTIPQQCMYCGKSAATMRRPSDMRKHILRHQRRYGCTKPQCYDRHGSKSDWYRHEDRLHRLSTAYLCREQDNRGQYCNMYAYSSDSFRQHLTRTHGYAQPERIEATIEAMCLPEDGRTRFWCGFCGDHGEIVANPDPTNPWNWRCLHVGKHMDKGGGKTISDWICPELQKRKGSMTGEQQTLV